MASNEHTQGKPWPATTEESVEQKLLTYLLNPDHAVGKHKARWFRSALGFTQTNYEALAQQIVFDPITAVETETDRYGTHYDQWITVHGANGNVVSVHFAWIRNDDGIVRLVTAIPT